MTRLYKKCTFILVQKVMGTFIPYLERFLGAAGTYAPPVLCTPGHSTSCASPPPSAHSRQDVVRVTKVDLTQVYEGMSTFMVYLERFPGAAGTCVPPALCLPGHSTSRVSPPP